MATFGTFGATQVLTAAELDARHGGTWRLVANQAIVTATVTPIVWDTEDADTDALLAIPSATATIPAALGPGTFAVTAFLAAGTTAAGILIQVVAGGVTYTIPGSTAFNTVTGTVVVPLVATNTISVNVWHNQGSNVNFTGRMYITRLGA